MVSTIFSQTSVPQQCRVCSFPRSGLSNVIPLYLSTLFFSPSFSFFVHICGSGILITLFHLILLCVYYSRLISSRKLFSSLLIMFNDPLIILPSICIPPIYFIFYPSPVLFHSSFYLSIFRLSPSLHLLYLSLSTPSLPLLSVCADSIQNTDILFTSTVLLK